MLDISHPPVQRIPHPPLASTDTHPPVGGRGGKVGERGGRERGRERKEGRGHIFFTIKKRTARDPNSLNK